MKRFLEPKDQGRRSWKIWFFDTSKQGIGCILIHFINILTAELFDDPCTKYLISFILDTSIGLLIIYLLIELVLFIAIKYNYETLNFGYYGESNPKLVYWLHQTLAYIIILSVQKIIIIFIILKWKAWSQIADLILWSIGSNLNVKIALILFIIPFVVNCFILWVTDNYLANTSFRSKKMLNFNSSSQAVAKKLQNFKNCLSTSAKLMASSVNMYDVMFINTKQKLRNEEDDNLVEINLETINNQTA